MLIPNIDYWTEKATEKIRGDSRKKLSESPGFLQNDFAGIRTREIMVFVKIHDSELDEREVYFYTHL